MNSRRKGLPKERETDLVKAALVYLRMRGFFCWRQNVGAMTNTYNTKRRYVRFGVPGVSDIIGCSPDGLFVAAEAKVGRNKPTADQKAFLASVREAGGLAVVFWNLDDLARAIDAARRGGG